LNSLIAFTTTGVSPRGLGPSAPGGDRVQKAVEILAHCGRIDFYIDLPVRQIDGRGGQTQFALECGRQRRRPIVEWGNALVAPSARCRGRKASRRRVAAFGGADWSELVTVAEQQLAWRCVLEDPS